MMNSAHAPGWYQRLNSLCNRQTLPQTYKEFCQEHEPRLKVLYPYLPLEQIRGKLLHRWKKTQPSEKPRSDRAGVKKQRSLHKFPVASFVREPKSHMAMKKGQDRAENKASSKPVTGAQTSEEVGWLTDREQPGTFSQEGGKTYKGRSFSLPSRVPEVISQHTPNQEKSILKNGKLPGATDTDSKRCTPRVSFSGTEHRHISPLQQTDPDFALSPENDLFDEENLDLSPSTTHTSNRMVTRSRKSRSEPSPEHFSNANESGNHNGNTPKQNIASPKFGFSISSPLPSPKFGSTAASPERHEKRFCLFEDDWIPPETSKARGRPKTVKLKDVSSKKASAGKKRAKKKQRKNWTNSPCKPKRKDHSSEKSKRNSLPPNNKHDIVKKTAADETEVSTASKADHSSTKSVPNSPQTNNLWHTVDNPEQENQKSRRKSPRFQRAEKTGSESRNTKVPKPSPRNMSSKDRSFNDNDQKGETGQSGELRRRSNKRIDEDQPARKKAKITDQKETRSLQSPKPSPGCLLNNNSSRSRTSSGKTRATKRHSDSHSAKVGVHSVEKTGRVFNTDKEEHNPLDKAPSLCKETNESPKQSYEALDIDENNLSSEKKTHRRQDKCKENRDPEEFSQTSPKHRKSVESMASKSNSLLDCVSDDDVPEQTNAATDVLLRIIMQLKSTTASQDVGNTVSSPTRSKATEVSDVTLKSCPIIHDSPSPSDAEMNTSDNILCNLFEDPNLNASSLSRRKRNIRSALEPAKQTGGSGQFLSPSEFM